MVSENFLLSDQYERKEHEKTTGLIPVVVILNNKI